MSHSLEERAKFAGFPLSQVQLAQFESYRALIKDWNQKIDITAITDDEEMDNKHFIDSLSIFRLVPSTFHGKVLDMGSGGGFPGIPMKIVDPDIELVLVDSLEKRVQFLEEVIQHLELKGISCVHARAEDFWHLPQEREAYDVVVSRAVAPLPTLLEYCLPGVIIGGRFIAMKGPGGLSELEDSREALRLLGGELKQIDEFSWTEASYQRVNMEIKKVVSTPACYPRGQAKPRKKPL